MQAHTFAVFTHTLIEPAAAGVLRKYSGKRAGADEGNAQKLYQELVKLMEQGMAGRASRSALEKEIISFCLDHTWNKPITSFLTRFNHLLSDLRELRDPADTVSYNDLWAISALDTCLSSHKDMTSHVNSAASTRAAVDAALTARGLPATPLTYDSYWTTLNDHATTLDQVAKARRSANLTNCGGRGGRGGGRGGRTPGRGGRRDGRGGRGAPENLPAGADVTDPAVRLSDAQYAQLTAEQRTKRYERKLASRQARQVHKATVTFAPCPCICQCSWC